MHWEGLSKFLDNFFTSLYEDGGDFVDEIYLVDDGSDEKLAEVGSAFELHVPFDRFEIEESTEDFKVSELEADLIVNDVAARRQCLDALL